MTTEQRKVLRKSMKKIIDAAKEQAQNETKAIKDCIEIQEWVEKERNYSRKMSLMRSMLR